MLEQNYIFKVLLYLQLFIYYLFIYLLTYLFILYLQSISAILQF